MEYQGGDIYKFYLNDKEIELSKYELEKIFFEYNEYITRSDILNSAKEDVLKIFETRKYNKKSRIKSLFNKYYNESKTKKEVFTQISLELKISYKAVEKAYYS